MILKPFLGNNALVLILLIPVMLLFHVLNQWFHFHIPFETLNLGLLGKTNPIDAWVSQLFAGLFVFGNAIFLNTIFNKYDFFERNTYAPALFYVLFMSFSHSFYYWDVLLVIHTFFFLQLWFFFELENGEMNNRQFFNAGAIFGLSAVLLPALVLVFPLTLLAMRMLKVYSIREFLLYVIGISLLLFNGLMWWWFSGHSINLNVIRVVERINYHQAIIVATGSVLILMLLLSWIGVQLRLQKSSIRFKKMIRSISWLTVAFLGFGSVEYIIYQQAEWFNLIFVPAGFLFTFAFIHKTWKGVASIFFYLTFLMAVIKFFLRPEWFQ